VTSTDALAPPAPDRTGRGVGPSAAPSGRPLLYSAPALLAVIVWVYLPLVATGLLSVVHWNLTSPNVRFVGWENYLTLAQDPDFLGALWRTVLYVVLMLPFATVIPLAIAIALWKRPGRASSAYRALLFLPVVLAPAANAVAWQFMLNPLQGVTNTVLGHLGLPQPNWLGDAGTALPTIVLITASKIIGLNVLLFSAALSALDRRCFEAAAVDGATEGEITRLLVLPQMRRSVTLLGLLCVVLAGQWVYTTVSLLTQGGPDGATDNIYYRLYTYGFTFFDIGTAAAAAVVLLVMVGVVYAGVRAVAGRRRSAR